jgi:hypothetical protein
MIKTYGYMIAALVFLVFTWPIIAVGEDVVLTSDGKVPGKPFQALQQQIDELQQQIDDIHVGIVKAYVTKNGDIELAPDEKVDVMTLSLPEGKYINTITIGAGYPPPWQDDSSSSFLECAFVDSQGFPVTGDLVGGNVFGLNSFAITLELEFSLPDTNDVVLQCKSDPLGDMEYNMTIYHTEWTAIKVSEIERQNILP